MPPASTHHLTLPDGFLATLGDMAPDRFRSLVWPQIDRLRAYWKEGDAGKLGEAIYAIVKAATVPSEPVLLGTEMLRLGLLGAATTVSAGLGFLFAGPAATGPMTIMGAIMPELVWSLGTRHFGKTARITHRIVEYATRYGRP